MINLSEYICQQKIIYKITSDRIQPLWVLSPNENGLFNMNEDWMKLAKKTRGYEGFWRLVIKMCGLILRKGEQYFEKSNKEQFRKAWNIICPRCEADTLQICPGGMLHINCLTLTFGQTDADSLLIVSTGDWFLADVSKSGPKLFLSLDSLETLNLNQVPPESTNCNYFQDIKGSCRSYQLSYHWLFSWILALSLSCWTWSTKSATNWSRPCL